MTAKRNATVKPADEAKDTAERGALDTSKVVGSADVQPEAPAAPAEAKKSEKNATVFVFKNGGTREFSQSVHGKGWEDLADEFQATNAKILATRDGKEIA